MHQSQFLKKHLKEIPSDPYPVYNIYKPIGLELLTRLRLQRSAFAEAYLHFIVFASTIKMLRQLNSQKLKKSFSRTKKAIFVKKKDLFHKKNFLTRQIICVHLYSLFIPSFCIFLTPYSSVLNRSSFPGTFLLCIE